MLGGGQLGRMFTLRARSMGYGVVVLDPDPLSPAGLVADRHLRAAYTDEAALDELAASCAAITTEFENVPAAALERLARTSIVRPPVGAVAIAQDRIAEKRFLQNAADAGALAADVLMAHFGEAYV
jgi:5-(carboxyamino)imidazole ribonucleotide synthase